VILQPAAILTIGHSTLAYEQFLSLLRGAGASAVADVRSAPHSRRCPQFNRDALRDALRSDAVAYVHLGRELGGRPEDRRFYRDGVADYEAMARAPRFRHGLERVVAGAARHRIALMCAEQDPLHCHRCLLVGRALHERGHAVIHILASGALRGQSDVERQLLAAAQQDRPDLFDSPAEQVAAAYRAHARRHAHSLTR
jgi:uncharacterized protein (DUF488 family)